MTRPVRRGWKTAGAIGIVALFTLGFAGSALAQGRIKDPNQVSAPPGFKIPVRPPVWVPEVPNGAFACMADQGDPQGTAGRDLSGFIVSENTMSNGKCRDTCGQMGFKYSGTQAASYCFCGNTAGSFGASTACTSRCTGAPGEVCGGIWANSVSYATGFTPPPPPPANGGQCVFDITSGGYRHTEVQRWEVLGMPTSNPTGTIKTYPVRWLLSGSGVLRSTSGSDSYLTTWTFNTMQDVHFLSQIIAGQRKVYQQETQLAPSVLTGTALHWVNGVLKDSKPVGAQRWEFVATLPIVASPTATQIVVTPQFPNLPALGFMSPTPTTVHCTWNFAL